MFDGVGTSIGRKRMPAVLSGDVEGGAVVEAVQAAPSLVRPDARALAPTAFRLLPPLEEDQGETRGTPLDAWKLAETSHRA